MNETHELLLTFLQHPTESVRVDYKAAVRFEEGSDFAIKLVKHCLGFANSGGGYLVVGFKEGTNGLLIPDSALADAVSKSYEVTRLAQHVNSFILGQDSIELIVHKLEFLGRHYPIISIRAFTKRPLFCGKTVRSQDGSEEILRKGAVYIRTREAKTTVVAGPGDWDALIDACVVAHRDEFVQAQKALLDQYFKPVVTTDQNPSPMQWIEDTRAAARRLAVPGSGRNSQDG